MAFLIFFFLTAVCTVLGLEWSYRAFGHRIHHMSMENRASDARKSIIALSAAIVFALMTWYLA
jgi:hypothetical protein